jgi:hypothetical protein
MPILLQTLLSEIDSSVSPLRTQIYMDLDGVLADIDKAFKKLSGGYTPRTFKDSPEFNGDDKKARRRFWQLINSKPGFWQSLEPMPDAMVLWNFVKRKYLDPKPVVLSAGQGTELQSGKLEWVHKHLGQDVQLLLSPAGARKPEFIIEQPNTMQVLVDDTPKNVDAWNNPEKHRFAILHKNAAETIRQLNDLTK